MSTLWFLSVKCKVRMIQRKKKEENYYDIGYMESI